VEYILFPLRGEGKFEVKRKRDPLLPRQRQKLNFSSMEKKTANSPYPRF